MQRIAEISRHPRRVTHEHDVEGARRSAGGLEQGLYAGTPLQTGTRDPSVAVDVLRAQRPVMMGRMPSSAGYLVVNRRLALRISDMVRPTCGSRYFFL